MKILYCGSCGLPYGVRSTTIEERFTPEGDKIYRKFKNMKHCNCKKNVPKEETPKNE